MSAKRNARTRDWPRGLYEPRPGYYVWRHPDPPHTTYPIGRVDLQFAKDEAIDANNRVAKRKPSLGDRVMGATNTMTALMDKMPVTGAYNTQKSRRALDKIILAGLGAGTFVHAVTVADCAKVLEDLRAKDHERTAQAIRSRMTVVFRKAMALGWRETNPVEPTEVPDPQVKRDRMTLEQFNAIIAVAKPPLALAMRLLLITGQDRDTVAKMHAGMVQGDYLVVQRAKTAATNQPVAIHVDIGLTTVGLTLRQLIEGRTGHFVVHEDGTPVFVDRLSKWFTEARKDAGIPDVMPNGKLAPTYYEIKSLAKRLYKAEGRVDTKQLFSHRDDRTDQLYADPRGVEPIYVKVNK